MADKRYYWIKLKTDFFNLNEIDFLLSQKNGCEYIVLYQMLCLNSANNNGELCSKIGEMIIPYNVEKIVRDTKHFDFDTVTVALELFKRLGLIYEETDNVLKIANFAEMVGSETAWAEKKRLYRATHPQLVEDNARTLSDKRKRLDIEIEKEKDIDKEIECIPPKSPKGGTRFAKPTLEEVQAYCRERGNKVDADKFYDHYTSNGWRVGKNPMKDWKAAVRTWERTSRDYDKGTGFKTSNPFLEMLEEERGR